MTGHGIMVESHDAIAEAIEALRASGHSVEPDPDLDRWQVDGESITSGDLMALALRLGLMDGPDRVQ